jgi:hypothetical protein
LVPWQPWSVVAWRDESVQAVHPIGIAKWLTGIKQAVAFVPLRVILARPAGARRHPVRALDRHWLSRHFPV